MTTNHLIETAHRIAADLPALSETIDRERRLPDHLTQKMAEAGFHKMMLAEEFGGLGADPITCARVVEILAAGDGSVGWLAMITAGTAHWATAMISDEAAGEVFSGNREAILVGTMSPHGKAVNVEGGVRVTGRWPFGSGIQVASWLASGCELYDGDTPVTDDTGARERVLVLTPTDECTVLDTWDTTGLRGTGSNDYVMEEVFVPAHRALKHPFLFEPQRPDPIYACFALSAPFIAAVSVGIARGAVEELKCLLREKTSGPEALANLGRADALVSSASTYMFNTLKQVWSTLSAGAVLPTDLRARFRGALTHAAQTSTEAVNIAFQTAGGAAIYKGHPLERRFRDIHTAAAHAKFRAGTMADSGRLFLDPASYKGEF